MDVGQLASAVGSLKVAGDIAIGLINLKTMAEVQAKAIELNQKIIAAQHEIFAANAAQTLLVERIRDLEKEIAAMKAWEGEKQRYQLASPLSGMFVFAVKESMSNGEPAHYLCARCFKNGKPSILQESKNKEGFVTIECHECGSVTATRNYGVSAPQYSEKIQGS